MGRRRKESLTPEQQEIAKIKARTKIRALVRQVFDNADWLGNLEGEELGLDVKKNVALLLRKSAGHEDMSCLTLEEKSLLRTPAGERTDADKHHLNRLIGGLRCFRRYPKKVKRQISGATYYMYYKAGRVIVKQNHDADASYFILAGYITILQNVWDDFDKEYVPEPIGEMRPGDMFGEVSLLHDIPRTATCIAATDVELLTVYRDDFDAILRRSVEKQWAQVKKALKCFTYFSDWNEILVRELCILSYVRKYDPLVTILSETKGSKYMVYFVLSGKCRIVEYIQAEVGVNDRTGMPKYTRYIPEEPEEQEPEEIQPKIRMADALRKKIRKISAYKPPVEMEYEDVEEEEMICDDDMYEVESRRKKGYGESSSSGSYASSYGENIAEEEIIVSKKPKTPSVESLPPNVHSYFMQLAIMNPGSVFGLGEYSKNRSIISIDTVVCLLVPRFWLTQHHPEIWSRIQHFLATYIPSPEKVFKEFVQGRKWSQEKARMMKSLLAYNHKPLVTTIHDVPQYTRLENDLSHIK